jgi:hypothetical protein
VRIAMLAVLVALQSAVPPPAPYVVERSAVGPVAIGASAQSVYEAFRSRVKLVDLQKEGDLSPALELKLVASQPNPSLIVDIGAKGSTMIVTGILVLDKTLQTKDGFGVGSTFGELRARYAIGEISQDEGCFCAWVEALGMAFRFDGAGRPALFSIRDPAKMPSDVKIAGIYLSR